MEKVEAYVIVEQARELKQGFNSELVQIEQMNETSNLNQIKNHNYSLVQLLELNIMVINMYIHKYEFAKTNKQKHQMVEKIEDLLEAIEEDNLVEFLSKELL